MFENPVRYGPFHAAAPELPEFFSRRNEKTDGFEDTAVFEVPLDHPLLNFGRYVINRFSAECPEFMLRTFPRQLLYELYMLKAGENKVVSNPMQRMLDTIEHYLEDNIDMKMLMRVASLSQPTIYRVFKKKFDCTPREYIAARRMERAAELLRKIQVIARRLQYGNPFYFSKCFKEHFNISPRAFRDSDGISPIMRLRREPSSKQEIHGKKTLVLYARQQRRMSKIPKWISLTPPRFGGVRLEKWRSKYRAIAIQEGVLSELADIMLLINLIKKEKCNSTNPINQK